MRPFYRVYVSALLSSVALFATAPLGRADDEGNRGDDHERAEEVYRGAVSGKILPLQAILKKNAAILPGEIIETKFELNNGIPVYELYYIDNGGRRQEVYFNARTGAPIIGMGD